MDFWGGYGQGNLPKPKGVQINPNAGFDERGRARSTRDSSSFWSGYQGQDEASVAKQREDKLNDYLNQFRSLKNSEQRTRLRNVVEEIAKDKNNPENEIASELLKRIPRSAGDAIIDFTRGSNEAFLGGAARGIVNAVNFVGSGFNADEANRRTDEFMRSTGQQDANGGAPLARGSSRETTAFQAGQNVGTAQGIATDIGLLATGAGITSSALRRLPGAQRLAQSGNAGRFGVNAGSEVGGGLVATGISQLQNPEQDFGQSLATGAAIDLAIPTIGAVSRGVRSARAARNATQPSSQLEQAVSETAQPAATNRTAEEIRQAQIQSRITEGGKYQKTAAGKALQKAAEMFNNSVELRRLDKQLAKQRGVRVDQLPATERLELLGDKSINSARQAKVLIDVPTPNSQTGQSLTKILEKYGEVLPGKTARSRTKAESSRGAEFWQYANNKFDLEVRQKNGFPVQKSLSDDEVARAVAAYEAKNPDAITDVRTVKEYNDLALDKAVEGGVIDAAEAAFVKQNYEFAVPLERLFSENLERVQIGGKSIGSLGRQTVLQSLKGNSDIPLKASGSVILKRIENAVTQSNKNQLAFKILERAKQGLVKDSELLVTPGNKTMRKEMREANKKINQQINATKRKFANASDAQKTKLQQEINELELQKSQNVGTSIEYGDISTTGRQTISGFVDGEQFKLELNPDLVRVLQGTDVTAQGLGFRIAKSLTTPFRALWTGPLNPIFTGVSTIFYDQPMSILLPFLYDAKAFARTFAPKAFAEAFKSINSNSAFQRELAGGGAQLIGASQVIQDASLNAASLASKSNFFKRLEFLAKNPKQLVESFDQFSGKLAGITRTRVAKGFYDEEMAKLTRQGMSKADAQKEAVAKAVWAYNNIMPNYARANKLVKDIDAALPYVNAGIAGTRSLQQAVAAGPVKAAGALTTAMGLYAAATAYNMSSQEGQDFYRNMAESGRLDQLDRDIVIILPGATEVKDKKGRSTGEWTGILRIPIPPELRALNKIARESTTNFITGTGQTPSSTALALFDFMTGGVRTVESPLVDTLRTVSGVNPRSDLFNSQPLVRGDMANLPQEQQVFDTTSEMAKFLANNDAASWFRKTLGIGISPVQADALLGQLGYVGNIAKGRTTESQLENRFTKAYGESTGTQYYKEYALVDALRSAASKEVTQEVKNNDLSAAYERAAEFNTEVDAAIDRYAKTYGADSELLTELNNLKINLTDRSIESRRKQ